MDARQPPPRSKWKKKEKEQKVVQAFFFFFFFQETHAISRGGKPFHFNIKQNPWVKTKL